MERACLWLIALGLAGASLSAPVHAAPGGVVTTHFYLFAPGDDELGAGPVVMVEGTELQYANLDPSPHSVTSVARTPAGGRVFDSGVLALGEAAPVRGTETLSPGDYPFICAVHPALMRGTLRVLARPT